MPKRLSEHKRIMRERIRTEPKFVLLRLNIATMLKNKRVEKGITQEKMEQDLNLGKAQCSRTEQAFQSPNLFTLWMIADYYDCDLKISLEKRVKPTGEEGL